MKKTTLCYIEADDKYLMMYRNKKKQDENSQKWVGVGGKFEPGETAEQCLIREVREETGLTLTDYIFHGVIHFASDKWGEEDMYLYTGTAFTGELIPECDEGTLCWMPKQEVLELPIWEGDKIFLSRMIAGDKNINISLKYKGDELVEVADNTKWVDIWGNAPSMTEWRPEQYAKNITLTYPIVVPFDGFGLKLKFSNKYGSEAVKIDKWSVLRADYSSIFTCEESFTMEEGCEHETAGFDADFTKGEKLYVQFYIRDFANLTSAVYTSGIYSGGDCTEGDSVGIEPDAYKTVATNWNYFLTDVIMCCSADKHVIIAYGDSITAQDWPDYTYACFMEEADNRTAFIRKAVSGTRLSRQYTCNKYRSYGIKGDIRFPHESSVDGADIILIQHGINDIIHPVGTEVNMFRPWSDLPTAEEMIECYRGYIRVAREKGLKIYFGTLLPIEGWRTYDTFRDDIRQQVNDWIRTTDEIDGVVDFDRAVCNPDNPKAFGPGFDSGDHLHPSKKAYKCMGELAYGVMKNK